MSIFNTATSPIKLDNLKANLPALKAMLKKTLKLDVGNQNALDIQAAALGFKDYQTAKGLAEKPLYSLKCNMGTKDQPFFYDIPLGHFEHLCEAQAAGIKAVENCQQFQTWVLYKDDESLGIQVETTPRPEKGYEYQVTLTGHTLGDIELALEEVQSRLDNQLGFDKNETGSFHFERVGSEVDFDEDDEF